MTRELDDSDREDATIEYAETRTLDRQYTDEQVTTDVYVIEITCSDPDLRDVFSYEYNGVLIGCPDCKQNSRARLENGRYKCVCGYENDLNATTLLLNGAMLGEVWTPYGN